MEKLLKKSGEIPPSSEKVSRDILERIQTDSFEKKTQRNFWKKISYRIPVEISGSVLEWISREISEKNLGEMFERIPGGI